MKPIRLFFVGAILTSLLFLVTTLVPNPAHAGPKLITTGEYPEALGARCADVEYKSNSITNADGPTFVTSPNVNGSTKVHIGLYVDQITEMDEGANSYKMQGFLDLIWCDPRLSFDVSETGTKVETYLEDDAFEKLNNMWWPNLEFVNEIEPISFEARTLLIHSDGTVEYRAKFGGYMASTYNLHSFPFDEQDLFVKIESFEWANDTMTFLTQEGIIGFSDEFYIPEWYVSNVDEHVELKKEPRDHTAFSQFIATIHVKRDPGVYTTKVMIPLGVIILISLVIFWMEPGAFEDRLGISMTGLLTAVAYQFIASQNLPRHVYNTYLDMFVFLSFFIILLSIGESALASYFIKNEKPEQAEQLDRVSRWFMPLLYIAMIFALYFIYTA